LSKRLISLSGVALVAALGLGRTAQAATITFDSTITLGANAGGGGQPGFVDDYQTPNPAIFAPDAFRTQGFLFGGYTIPLTGGRTSPDLNIMLDASQCLAQIGVVCANDGSHYLLGTDPFSMFIEGANMSMTRFDATGLFDNAGCTLCDPNGTIFPALFIKVMGVRNGAPNSGIVADETFALTSGFQTFVLTDPDWANVSKAIFRPVDANGNVVARILAVDNINASSTVPEPASFVLLGSGLLGAIARRRRKTQA
jgi:PEP-CTERM motif